MKLAIFFPGIGYHTDKPLLYYSRKLARLAGYDTIDVSYGGFPSDVKGNPEKMTAAFQSALSQTQECLKDVDFSSCEQLLFVSKSVGTAVASAFATEKGLHPFQIFYTPVEASFRFIQGDGIAFTGTHDPWVDTAIVELNCSRLNIPLTIIPNANHSLETGDVQQDLTNLKQIMEVTEAYLLQKGDH